MIMNDETNKDETEAEIQKSTLKARPSFLFTKKNMTIFNENEIDHNMHNSLIKIDGNTFIEEPNAGNDDYKTKKLITKKPFSRDEDYYLLFFVQIFGDNNWISVSECMKQKNFDRSSRQCRDRYSHYLDPRINKNKIWTKEEEDLLVKLVENEGNKWKKFENYFPGRTEVSLRNKYQLINRKKVKKVKKVSKVRKIQKVKKNIDIMSNCYSFLDSYYNVIKNVSKPQINDHKNVPHGINHKANIEHAENDISDIFRLIDDDNFYDFNELFF